VRATVSPLLDHLSAAEAELLSASSVPLVSSTTPPGNVLVSTGSSFTSACSQRGEVRRAAAPRPGRWPARTRRQPTRMTAPASIAPPNAHRRRPRLEPGDLGYRVNR